MTLQRTDIALLACCIPYKSYKVVSFVSSPTCVVSTEYYHPVRNTSLDVSQTSNAKSQKGLSRLSLMEGAWTKLHNSVGGWSPFLYDNVMPWPLIRRPGIDDRPGCLASYRVIHQRLCWVQVSFFFVLPLTYLFNLGQDGRRLLPSAVATYTEIR